MFKQIQKSFDFIQMEKNWLSHWYKHGIVKKYLFKNNKSSKRFSFQDGPITANNPMGVHHAWGRTYKDLWPKFFNLLGYKQRFQNGFDCQGLWVEVEVEKELGLKNKKEIERLIPNDKKASIAKFVDLCKERVKKYAKIQTEQSKRLGYFADWENSYFTMSDENNYMIWHFLKVCFENGWIYKGKESVPWCPRCETAISQHEMLTEDYKEVVHKSIFFGLPVNNRNNEYLLVWTTTPWTLPANIAVAVDEELDYVLVEVKTGNKFWIAEGAIKRVFGEEYKKILKRVKGKSLVGLNYKGPFDDLPAVKKVALANKNKFHQVIPTDISILPISIDEGTGLVHTAVSAGSEDFKLGKKLGLPMIPVIADNAQYLDGFREFSGKNAKKHPELILDYLINKSKRGENWVFKIHNYKHRYPACWRCKTELVWKVADEWYIAMDKKSKRIANNTKANTRQTLRQMMIGVAKKIKWMPEFGLERELDWLKNMHDWLISKKNRYWGLALPIYECKKCLEVEVIGSKEELQKKAILGWDKFEGHSPHKPWIDEVSIKCKKCGSLVKRISDVGNPWLDAGIVPYSTITSNNKGRPLYLADKDEWLKWFPVDFITESFPGQFKNWFYAMIAESTVLENINPFKTVLGFGTLLGEDSRPMHKSWGNAIEFNEGADKIGVDVMRWMYSRQNPSENMLFGYKKADEVRRQFYLICWNIYKFFVEYANLDKFQPKNKKSKDLLDKAKFKNVLDRWILSRFSNTILIVEKNLKIYDAKTAALSIEKFISDLSTWYIRRSRERVWINSEIQEDKEDFYQTLSYILSNTVIILSPFMPFLSEEIYTNLTGMESVHLSTWPKIDKNLIDYKLESEMTEARRHVEVGHALRKLKNIKVRIPMASLEIDVKEEVKMSDEIYELILKELNVKNIVNKSRRYPKKEVKVSEEELRHEGELRELIRSIQSERKKLNLSPTDRIDLTIPNSMEKYIALIEKKVLTRTIRTGRVLRIEKQ